MSQLDQVLVRLDRGLVGLELRHSKRTPQIVTDLRLFVLFIWLFELLVDLVLGHVRGLRVNHLSRLDVTEEIHLWSKVVLLQPLDGSVFRRHCQSLSGRVKRCRLKKISTNWRAEISEKLFDGSGKKNNK